MLCILYRISAPPNDYGHMLGGFRLEEVCLGVLFCCMCQSPITLLWSCYSLAGHPLQHLAFQGYRLEEVRHPLTSSCVLSISSLHSFSLFSHPYCGLLSIKSYGLCLRYPINGESNKCQLRLRLDSHIPSIMRLWSPSPILS